MQRMPGGEFAIGSPDFYPGEAPAAASRWRVSGSTSGQWPSASSGGSSSRRGMWRSPSVSSIRRCFRLPIRRCSCLGRRLPAVACSGGPVRRREPVVVRASYAM